MTSPTLTFEDLESLMKANPRFLCRELLRRGVDVQLFVPGSGLVRATFGSHVEYLIDIDSSIVPYPAAQIANDKFITKQLLMDAGISTPPGKLFSSEERFSALEYALTLGFPVVAKPVSGTQGTNVFVRLEDVAELDDALLLLAGDAPSGRFLVEQYIPGDEHRIFITRDGRVAVLHREPASVVGDGEHPIAQLAVIQSAQRWDPRPNCLCPIEIDDVVIMHLRKQRLTPESVPAPGERIGLRLNTNLKTGGYCKDVTDLVHPSVIEICSRVLSLFPGLPYAGVDFISRDITAPQTSDSYAVIEVNPLPTLGIHEAPPEGKPRPVSAWVADMIFPETVEADAPRMKPGSPIPSFAALDRSKRALMPREWIYRPTYIQFEMTTRCPVACPECAILSDVQSAKHERLEAGRIVELLSEAAQLGTYSFGLTGGEPFLHVEDLCRIVEQSPIDCYKIQTSAATFTSKRTTAKALTQLKEAGFGARNSYMLALLQCSVGIQNFSGGVPEEQPLQLAAQFFEIFAQEPGAALSYLLSLPPGTDAPAIRAAQDTFAQKLTGVLGGPLPQDRLIIKPFPLTEYRDTPGSMLPLAELVARRAHQALCLPSSSSDTPESQFMIRANGDTYACGCFGYVFKLGNIHNESLEVICKKGNAHPGLAAMLRHGLAARFEKLKRRRPGIEGELLPERLSACQLCGVLTRFESD